MMKRRMAMAGGALLVAAALAWTLVGCGPRRPVLHLYTWADYVKPELVEAFEREYRCRVVIDTFDSNEAMYAKIRAGATGYDLITPTSYMAKVLHEQGLLQPLRHEWLPNLRNVDPEYLKLAPDPQMRYSVPYMLGYACVAWLDDRLPGAEPTWTLFDRTDVRGRATMLNDMRETLGAALKLLGYSINTRDPRELEAARDVVIRWKRNLAKFENEQYKTGLASGEFWLVHGYSGDIMQVMEENPNIRMGAPREGTIISVDDFVIPASARQVELAHRYIDFMLRPEVAAQNMEFIGYRAPNRPAMELVSEAFRNHPAIAIPPQVLERSEIIGDVGEALALYTRMWDQVKAAQ